MLEIARRNADCNQAEISKIFFIDVRSDELITHLIELRQQHYQSRQNLGSDVFVDTIAEPPL
jgi:hypothetical protein